MTSFTVEELTIPDAIGDDDASDFIETIEVRNSIEAASYGTSELTMTAAETLPYWLDREHAPRRLFGVRIDGRIVGRAYYERNVADDDRVAWSTVEVLPDQRRRGIGTALADTVEQLARSDSRQRLLVYVVSPDGPGDRLTAATGFGTVPLANPEVRFLLSRGFTLEQIERGSRLALPLDGERLRDWVAEASERAGDDYAVHSWVGRVPERWRDDMATLFTRMSTDAPSAGLAEPEDPWTAQRVSDDDDRHEANPRTVLTAVVEHVPSGRLVGYTSLSVPPEVDRAVSQEDTLVLREHRGHRLGMLLKVANLDILQRERPGHPSVITFNAEENRHMLQVNEDVGFTPIGYEGAWRKSLS